MILQFTRFMILARGHLVGEIRNLPDNPAVFKVPGEWLPLEGQILKRADYPELYEVIRGRYSDNVSETDFMLPDLRGRVVGERSKWATFRFRLFRFIRHFLFAVLAVTFGWFGALALIHLLILALD